VATSDFFSQNVATSDFFSQNVLTSTHFFPKKPFLHFTPDLFLLPWCQNLPKNKTLVSSELCNGLGLLLDCLQTSTLKQLPPADQRCCLQHHLLLLVQQMIIAHNASQWQGQIVAPLPP